MSYHCLTTYSTRSARVFLKPNTEFQDDPKSFFISWKLVVIRTNNLPL